MMQVNVQCNESPHATPLTVAKSRFSRKADYTSNGQNIQIGFLLVVLSKGKSPAETFKSHVEVGWRATVMDDPHLVDGLPSRKNV